MELIPPPFTKLGFYVLERMCGVPCRVLETHSQLLARKLCGYVLLLPVTGHMGELSRHDWGLSKATGPQIPPFRHLVQLETGHHEDGGLGTVTHPESTHSISHEEGKLSNSMNRIIHFRVFF